MYVYVYIYIVLGSRPGSNCFDKLTSVAVNNMVHSFRVLGDSFKLDERCWFAFRPDYNPIIWFT